MKPNPSLTLILVALLLINPIFAQKLELSWTYPSEGKIIAGATIDNTTLYIGNEKGTFFAIDQDSGKSVWKFETNGNIQAKALLIDEKVFFESANVFYALDRTNGDLIWKYDPEIDSESFTYKDRTFPFKLDFFDDKRSTGFVYEKVIYIGTSGGTVIGLDADTGKSVFEINSNDNSPVRSSPLIHNGDLYFGDWNGVVYCYNLQNNSLKWTKNTYREKLYSTFGGIASEFIVHNNQLIFGARNHMLNVLWTEDGQKEWTYTDPQGGWIIGDPVMYKDTLYMGGSDNFSMLAFDPKSGKLLWKNERTKNIYGKPIVNDEWLIYSAGNSYNPNDKGEVVLLNRKTGKEISEFLTETGVFSSPALSEQNLIFFGSNNGTIYCLKITN